MSHQALYSLGEVQAYLSGALRLIHRIPNDGLRHQDFAALRAIKARIETTQKQVEDMIESLNAERKKRDQAAGK